MSVMVRISDSSRTSRHFRDGPEADIKTQGCYLLRPATFPELRKDFIHVEASCLLPLWVIPERHQKLTHIVLCRDKKEGVVEQPVVIGIRGDVGALVRIRPQVEYFRNPQIRERVGPNEQCSRG